MTLAAIEDHPLARWAGLLGPARQLAEVLADTAFVPTAMRGKPDEVCATIMLGDELQLGPMQALQGIHVVEGRPSPSAELARALILRAGHTFTIHEMTGTRCRVSGLRLGRPEAERVVVEWTSDMARSAGLLGRSNWQRYPRAMLLARATGDLARILFPDVVKGLGYLAEDDSNLQALDTWSQVAESTTEAPAPAPARAPVQRRTRPTRGSLGQAPQPDQERPAEQPTAPPHDSVRPVTTTDLPEPPAPPARSQDQVVQEPPIDGPPVAPGRHAAPVEQPAPVGDLEPEPAPDEPPGPAGPVMMGDGQRRGLFAMLRAILGDQPNEELARMERLELVSVLAGRQVDSSSDLTRAEAFTVLEGLGRLERGTAVMYRNASGDLGVADNPEPEPPPQQQRTTQQPPSDPWGDQPPLPEEPAP